MTTELLEKGNKLNRDIYDLEHELKTLTEYGGKNKDSVFSVNGIYRVCVPKEVTSKIEMLIKIELSSILEEKRKQFEELGGISS